jgi:transposase InsO family protein
LDKYKLCDKKIVIGLPDFSIEQQGVCTGCALGNNAKVAFPSIEHRFKGILDLIHSNVYVCGPMLVTLVQGNLYYVTFMYDFSRKNWIYFMNTKDEVFSEFHEFNALVENQRERKIMFLRSDNGGEYTSNDFKHFCKETRIKRELIVSYNPQQNGVVDVGCGA